MTGAGLVLNPLADPARSQLDDLRRCAALGFPLGVTLTKLRDPRARRTVVAAVQHNGWPVPYLHHSGLYDLDDRRSWTQHTDRLLRSLDFCEQLGTRVVLCTTGPAGRLPTWEAAAEAFCEAVAEPAAEARRRGVSLSVEQTNGLRHDLGFVHTLADLVRLTGEADVDLCADLFWCFREPALRETLRAAGPRLTLVQVADLVPGAVSMPDRAVPGDGVVPFDEVFGALREADFAGPVDLELIGPRITAEGVEAARMRAVEKLGAVLRAEVVGPAGAPGTTGGVSDRAAPPGRSPARRRSPSPLPARDPW
jgi:sugar phosphate isomerase/epimerase